MTQKPLPPPTLSDIGQSIEREKARIKYYIEIQSNREKFEEEFTRRQMVFDAEYKAFHEKLLVAEDRIEEAKHRIVSLEKQRHDLRSALLRKGNPARGVPQVKYPSKPKWMTDEQFENFMKNVPGFEALPQKGGV